MRRTRCGCDDYSTLLGGIAPVMKSRHAVRRVYPRPTVALRLGCRLAILPERMFTVKL